MISTRLVTPFVLGMLGMTMTMTSLIALADELASQPIQFGPYLYESKPDDEAFDEFNPMKAPTPGPMVLRKGDRLAILGDSITEQKRYSRMIETYLTVCYPQLEITTRQYGWSGEKTDGMLRRLEQDVLRFSPTVATLSYGMNDARYRPFDWVNGRWYRDHYTAIVRKLKASGAEVVVGSPGCAGKIASWVDAKNGTLEEHNLHLCTLRDICVDIANTENVRFADVFWPMYKAQVLAGKQYDQPDNPFEVAGSDGIHPGWAGHVIMAHAYLRAMGVDGKIGTFHVNFSDDTVSASEGHVATLTNPGTIEVTSSRYPFVAVGSLDD
ncbi:GDSL-like Lipase/Acylhydrolase [Rubripirellula tenax]|uniref:GDSL-like Lipase/Acylhydrolase n=1 Tax=Rubripirellula tenax TaxID=2528015 RepID=A0A5C6FFY1_9BACT|nr:SGNH/GDSL hydrolase family protein [Rubripirellula tenax]TWU59026.1 GDSL-like Lipase/Acylhydrolase [Rubripirellula tenax]